MVKFIFCLGDHSFETLQAEAQARDIKVQQLIRAIIIPDWIRQNIRQDQRPNPAGQAWDFPIGRSQVGRLPANPSTVWSTRNNYESPIESIPAIRRK